MRTHLIASTASILFICLSAVILHAEDADKAEVIKVEQTVRVSLVDCLREEISSFMKKVPDGAIAEDWKDDWSNIFRDCKWLELEITDFRKLNLDTKSLVYFNSDKPTIRVVLPVRTQSRITSLFLAA